MNWLNRILVYVCLTFILPPVPCIAQENIFKSLESLFKTTNKTGNIRVINNSNTPYYKQQNHIINGRMLDKMTVKKGGLFINLNGTGKIFRIDSNHQLKRLDSTIHTGSTFGALLTNYNDTIIQIGGYGFWETNGAVRFFNEKYNEWDIFRTNRNVRFAIGVNAISFEDKINDKIFIVYRETGPEYVKGNQKDLLYVQCFDLKTKKWWNEERILNKNIASQLYELKEFAVCAEGLILGTRNKQNVLLLDFQHNKCFAISDDLISDIIQTVNKAVDYISFSTENAYNVYSINDKTLKSFPIGKNSLKQVDVPVYREISFFERNKNAAWYLFLILLNITSIASAFIFIKRKKKYNQIITTEKIFEENTRINTVTIKIEELFEEIEKKILKTVLNNQKNFQKNTSIEELNKILGIEDRPMKIQNNIRAEVILTLNKKFSTYLTTNDFLVERIRSDFDKRFFEYKLNRKYINIVERL